MAGKEKTAFFLEVIPPEDKIDFLLSVKKKVNSSRRKDESSFSLKPHLTLAYPFICGEEIFRTNLTALLTTSEPFKINLDRVETIHNPKNKSGIIFLTTKKPQEIEKLQRIRFGLLKGLDTDSADFRNKNYIPHITLSRVASCESVGELERQKDFFDANIGKVSFEISEIKVRQSNNGRWHDVGIFTIGAEEPTNEIVFGSQLITTSGPRFNESGRASFLTS